MDPASLWAFLPLGYFLTVAIEIPILMIGLSAGHSYRRRLLAGLWLTACTYPIVVLVLPLAIGDSQCIYLAVAETFAPFAECALFWAAFGAREDILRRSMWRDFAAITLANLASFAIGAALFTFGW